MPYLQSVLKEALRMHPATGLPLWRVVPEGGLQLGEHWLPPGTNVGLNSWVAHYDKRVFGEDAHVFRPERWEEAKALGGERFKLMEANYMPVSSIWILVCAFANQVNSLDLDHAHVLGATSVYLR